MSPQKIKSNIYIIFTLILVITLSTIIFIAQSQTSNIVSEITLSRVQVAKQELISYLQDLEDRAMQRAELVAGHESLIIAMNNSDHEAIQKILLDFSTGLDMISICDSEGVMIFRSYSDISGDNALGYQDIANVFRTGLKSSSISLIPDGFITISASAPVYDKGRLIGVVSCYFDLHKSEYLDTFKERTACEASIFLGTEQVATTLMDQYGNRIIGRTADAIVTEMIFGQKREYYTDIIAIYGSMYGGHYTPLISNDRIIGMLFTGVNIDSILASQRTMSFWILLVSIFGIVAVLFFGIASNRFALRYARTSQELSEKTASLNIMEKIREADEYTQLLLDATPMSCTLWDANLSIVNCNQETLNLFRMKTREEFNEKFFELSPEFQPCGGKSKDMVSIWLKKAFEEGFARTEWMHQLLTGEALPCEVTLVRVKYKEGYLVAGYSRDLREHKANIAEINLTQEKLRLARDAAEAANLAKSSFLANMSHEIRTPMNSIIGFSELAQDGNIPPKTREYLNNISENGKWLLSIINDILDISKIESGKMNLENITFSLHEIFTHCQSLIMPKTLEKGLFLHCHAEPSLGKTLLGDPIRLRQALINILSNAVKFTNTGTIKLSAAIVSLDENKATIHFEVKDSGIGMSSEQVERVFLPFIQADDSVTRKYGGTGLGLAITKNIIEMMGGKLEVESAPGAGSKLCFDLTFDVVNTPANMPSHRIVLSELEKPNFEGEILVCEDNNMNQQVICEHLERVGFKTVVANNGKEGVDVVQNRKERGEKQFDLIFMDIHMPVMDGLEAASKITELKIATPIVAMTANIMSNQVELYKKSGIPDRLSKPFTSQELWDCLLKYFQPVSISTIDKQHQSVEDEKLFKQLEIHFAKNNQTTYAKIKEAADNGDIKLAFRIAHTLKSNAGQIGKKQLQNAAAKIEAMLADGKNLIDEEQASILETELKSVLEELSPLLAETNAKNKTEIIDTKEICELIKKLDPMLMNRNPECMSLLDDILKIPGAEELAQQIENFEFKKATASLSALKEKMDIR
ncbi:MAG: ATP-binding protein [Spirochaetaceae bacterium]|nr:ATP-binding protein [Spirochaetaceae bacterium]